MFKFINMLGYSLPFFHKWNNLVLCPMWYSFSALHKNTQLSIPYLLYFTSHILLCNQIQPFLISQTSRSFPASLLHWDKSIYRLIPISYLQILSSLKLNFRFCILHGMIKHFLFIFPPHPARMSPFSETP